MDGQGFEHRAVVSESSLSRELSAGEVVGPAFDEQIKRSAGTLAFTLPLSSLWIREGTFQMMPVCLSFFDKQIQLSASPLFCLMRKWKPKRVHYSFQYFCHYRLCLSVLSLCGCIIQPNPRPLFSRRIWQRDSFHNLSTLPPACHLSPRESRTLSQLSDMTENFWT